MCRKWPQSLGQSVISQLLDRHALLLFFGKEHKGKKLIVSGPLVYLIILQIVRLCARHIKHTRFQMKTLVAKIELVLEVNSSMS